MTALCLLAAVELLLFRKKGCLLKALLAAGAGVGLLLLLSELNISLPVTKGTLLFSAVLGVPGSILLSLLTFCG